MSPATSIVFLEDEVIYSFLEQNKKEVFYDLPQKKPTTPGPDLQTHSSLLTMSVQVGANQNTGKSMPSVQNERLSDF